RVEECDDAEAEKPDDRNRCHRRLPKTNLAQDHSGTEDVDRGPQDQPGEYPRRRQQRQKASSAAADVGLAESEGNEQHSPDEDRSLTCVEAEERPAHVPMLHAAAVSKSTPTQSTTLWGTRGRTSHRLLLCSRSVRSSRSSGT